MIDKKVSVQKVAKYAADWFAEVVKMEISLDELTKENIFPVLINQEESERLNGSAPLRPFLDLMIGFRIILDGEPQKPGERIRTSVLDYSKGFLHSSSTNRSAVFFSLKQKNLTCFGFSDGKKSTLLNFSAKNQLCLNKR